MSRCYEIQITVSGYNRDFLDEILDSISELDYCIDTDSEDDLLALCPETINITAGNSEASVAREISEAVWEANRAFCKVDVHMRDMDSDVPVYSLDEASYDKWKRDH